VLFLSYAEEDGKAGAEVAEWLRTHGFDVYHWQDVRHRGGLFIEQIEDAIAGADAFIALLSPSFLASSWCRRERELAMQRELDLTVGQPRAIFIHVLKISDTPPAEAGFLRSYDWVDLTTPENRESALGGLAARLGQSADAATPEIASPDRPDDASTDQAPSAGFHGHQDDLNTVMQGLTDAVGPHFWLVTAPPGLGKSGFLRRLSAQLTSRRPSGWTMRLIDLRDQPSDVRGNAGVLLTRLFGRPITPDADPEALQDFAADISVVGAHGRSRASRHGGEPG
jgi:TIR domain